MNPSFETPSVRAASIAALLLCLVGCGGDPRPVDQIIANATAAAARAAPAQAPAAASTDAVPPLFADDGSVMPSPPSIVPSDPGARTRAGRYATAQQADQLEATMGPRVVRFDAADVGWLGAEGVAGIVHGLQAAGNLGRDDPVLVQGRDLRLAARLADQLADEGLKRVWLVTH